MQYLRVLLTLLKRVLHFLRLLLINNQALMSSMMSLKMLKPKLFFQKLNWMKTNKMHSPSQLTLLDNKMEDKMMLNSDSCNSLIQYSKLEINMHSMRVILDFKLPMLEQEKSSDGLKSMLLTLLLNKLV
jgi:hypothetical protein